ncbi:DKNYY domain-containing protein [Crateriforma conspicua]|uniref:DKNYY domain-containing protein n=1 Tax=Crateriforma conspicua TaxID=2527996 RepID=UPI0011A7CF89|nr:DKNYY domain-containing protein [Crateriforma conspicua]
MHVKSSRPENPDVIPLELNMAKYTHLGGEFWKSADKVFHNQTPINLSPKTTMISFGVWACDGVNVYALFSHRRSIDAESFEPINAAFAKDKFGVYTWHKKVPADAESFIALDSGQEHRLIFMGEASYTGGYGKDKENVYFCHIKVKKADRDTFVSLGKGFGKDSSNVFFEQHTLPGADPSQWRYVGSNFSRDHKHVYYENKKLPKAKPDNFKRLAPYRSSFAYDGYNYFEHERLSSRDAYIETLNLEVKSLSEMAEIVRTGKFEEVKQLGNRELYPPDEDMFRSAEYGPGEYNIGDTIESMTSKFGQPQELSRHEYMEVRYDDLESDEQAVYFSRGKHVLKCIFRNSKLTTAW